MQIKLADIVGKTIVTCYVPADQKAVTFVLKEGRMSLGAPRVWLGGKGASEDAKILTIESRKNDTWNELLITTDKGSISVGYEGADSMTELPE